MTSPPGENILTFQWLSWLLPTIYLNSPIAACLWEASELRNIYKYIRGRESTSESLWNAKGELLQCTGRTREVNTNLKIRCRQCFYQREEGKTPGLALLEPSDEVPFLDLRADGGQPSFPEEHFPVLQGWWHLCSHTGLQTLCDGSPNNRCSRLSAPSTYYIRIAVPVRTGS